MPNLDGGHYFLTVLAPVRTDFIQDAIPGRSGEPVGGGGAEAAAADDDEAALGPGS